MNLAIIGTGKIANDALYAMQPVDGLHRVALFARPHSKEKGEALAARYGVGTVYTDYDELLCDERIDTVYIGIVNTAHFPFALAALQAGKHVILEKPFTVTLQEALRLQEETKARGVFLLEAINILHLEVFGVLKEQLPAIGPIRSVRLNYSQYSSRYEAYKRGEIQPVFDPTLDGGSLKDLNVYNLHYCAGLFGEPLDAVYYPNRGHNGVDTSGTAVLTYDGFSACCTAAKDSDSPSYVVIQGENGWMQIEDKPNVAENLLVSVARGHSEQKDKAGVPMRTYEERRFSYPIEHHRLTCEFRAFEEIIRMGDQERAASLLDESITVMRILDRIAQHG